MNFKKVIYITLILLIIYPTSIYADGGECKIKDSAAPILLEYLKNVDTVTNSIISKAYTGEKNNNPDAINYLIASLGKSINYYDLYSSFDFNVKLPITNEVPKQITRDHDKITKKTEKLINLSRKLIEDGYGNVSVEDVCSGVNNCQLKGLAKVLLADIIENNKNMVVFYRYKIMDNEYNFNKPLILTPKKFEVEMGKYYNKDTLLKCSKYEGGYFNQIKDKMDSIGKMFTKGHGMYDDWKEGFNLLKGINEENKETEKEILKNYLSSINMDKKHSEIMLKNLEKYNLGGLSASDPISNSYNYAYNNVDKTKDVFENALIKLFSNGKEKVSPEEISGLMPNIQSTLNIENQIKDMFQPEVYFAITEDNSTEKLQKDIIEMHIWIIDAIKLLTKTIPVAEKICNQQCSGGGKCSYQ